MGPNGSENFKTLLLQIAVKRFETGPEFSSQWSSQKYVWDFWNFEFMIFNDFFYENSNFTIVAYGEIKNLNIWKTSDRRAKRSEIWDSWVLIQHIRGTFGLLAFKVILRSFGALAIPIATRGPNDKI